MGRSLLAVVVAVGLFGGPNLSVARAEVAAPVAYEAFPLPKDAVSQQDKAAKKTKSTGRIRTYDVPRGRDLVVAEARATLATGKWEIVKDEPSPSGNAVRLTVKKHGKTWKAGFTGDESRAVIILTAPP
jgi:hypothetical protein